MGFWDNTKPSSEGSEPKPTQSDILVRGATPEERTEEPETERLPSLKLTEVARSEEKLGEVYSAALVGDYFVVVPKGQNDIRIFDGQTTALREFQPPLSTAQVLLNGTVIAESYRLLSSANYLNTHYSQMLPSRFRNLVLNLLGAAYENISVSQLILNKFKDRLTGATVILGGNGLVMRGEKGSLTVFVTQDEAGKTQRPRNWRRYEPTDVKVEIEDAIKAELDRLASGFRSEKVGQYTVAVTNTKLTVLSNERSRFEDQISAAQSNLAFSPRDLMLSYCASDNPTKLVELSLQGDPADWRPVERKFPRSYQEVKNLTLDGTGNFFIFQCENQVVVLDRETLEEQTTLNDIQTYAPESPDRIRCVDKDGYVVIYQMNTEELAREKDRQRVARLAAEIDINDIFGTSTRREAKTPSPAEELSHLVSLREQFEKQFESILSSVTTLNGLLGIRSNLTLVEQRLLQQGLKEREAKFVLSTLEGAVAEKEREFAQAEAEQQLDHLEAMLATGLSLTSSADAKQALAKLQSYGRLLDDDSRQRLQAIQIQLEQKTSELFRVHSTELLKDVSGLVNRTKSTLEGFTAKAQMDDWLEYDFPQLKARLAGLANDVPAEADAAFQAISKARGEVQRLAEQFEQKFVVEYAKVREKAAERKDTIVEALHQDISSFIERLRSKDFMRRADAEQYATTSTARQAIVAELEALKNQYPDEAKELDRFLKVQLSNALTEIERMGKMEIAATGQQMVLFGNTYFPKWEAKVHEKQARRVDLTFVADEKTHGPGVGPRDAFGDVAVVLTGSDGSQETIRLYERLPDEDEWRRGLLSYRGEEIPPSYLQAADFPKVKRDYVAWIKGALKGEYRAKRAVLTDLYMQREKVGARSGVDATWKSRYEAALRDYADFCATHHIVLLRRIERIQDQPDIAFTNGKGFVPEWQSHWVEDAETEQNLEQIAEALKMQLELQEGILNLKGHAGTGKDVLVKMFCAKTNRPYFAIDCTKWTTEYDLSEDLTLESKDGASQTVRVPSAVLNGIRTPGAVVYFNEFNAMPEQAQIFLHALMDEKRSLTLKTESGRVIRAHPSVLLVSSMNPGYEGTFAPQYATRSRMVSLEIGYPPIARQPALEDPNRNPLVDSSEPLRMAREVDSLADFTFEADVTRNEFAKMWDRYVNGLQNGAGEFTATQRFDVETILALTQFTARLRDEFIKIFEKTREARNALPVRQPLTGRELRRCAYALNQLTTEQKTTSNPEAIARDFLDRFYLTHIDSQEDRVKIRTALATWTSSKRVGI